MLSTKSCVVWIFWWLGLSSAFAQETHALEVRFTNALTNGPAKGHLTVSTEEAKPRAVFDAAIEGAHVLQLPFGRYRLVVTAGAFRSERAVTFTQADEVVMFFRPLDDSILVDIPSAKPPALSVRVLAPAVCNRQAFLWAKLVPAAGNEIRERRIGESGFVLFEPVEYGNHQLLVLEGDTVRASRTVEVRGPLTIVETELSVCPEPSK